MYICICRGITDTQIRNEVHEGACCLRDVSRRLGVATQCGKCAKCAIGVVEETLNKRTDDGELAGVAVPA